MQNVFRLLFVISFLFSCSPLKHEMLPKENSSAADSLAVPDYSKPESWAALPGRADYADYVPHGDGLKDEQQAATADVFFVYPTSYIAHTKKSTGWNADVADPEINKSTDSRSILYQASVFNGAARIYAPRYRQANLSAYYSDDKAAGAKALDLAYGDVKNAFEYYLAHYNNGRPIILASHSQGSTHARRLLKDEFDGKDLQKQLVAAYIIGMDVYDTVYTVLKPCGNAEETGCYISWRTYAAGYIPKRFDPAHRPAVCTNPLTWKTDSVYAPRELNKGGILKNFNKVIKNICDAQVDPYYGVLRIKQPHFFGNELFHLKNYHIVDYNLFYMNIRENAMLRAREFGKKAEGRRK